MNDTDANVPENRPRDTGASFFLNPYETVTHHANRLPHWQQPGVLCFVTWRLADSLPRTLVAEWKEARDLWLRAHPQPWDASTREEYRERFSARFDQWLDQGVGSCILREPRVSKIVADALQHFDGQRYELASFVVMPNHVHVIFRPLSPHRMQTVVKSWKGFTARAINQITGRAGSLWGEDYWDRLIRSAAHYRRYVEYIENNPAKANLPEGHYVVGGSPERFAQNW